MTEGATAAGRDVYVGLMSGTSCDGVSAAAVRFVFADDDAPRGFPTGVDLLGFVQRPYTPAQRARLLDAMQGGSARDYCRLAADLGGWFADAAAALLADAGVARASVRAVASHGQTLWHEPGHSTWQSGDASAIAERLGVDVVSDFRTRDVAAGGQGAPLVPIADALLFAGDEWRLLQNLGGIGNVTVVPPRAADGAAPDLRAVRAFDTGPGVAVVDAVVRALRPALAYDVDGRLAAAGTPNRAVVDALLTEPYFAAPPPKSTGRELFGVAYADRLRAGCAAADPRGRDEDVVATAVLLTAGSLADAYRRFVPEPTTEVLLSGGGARNPALVASVTAELARAGLPIRVRGFADAFFDGEAKEAVAFALLGYLHLARLPGNVPAATGARGARVLGALTPA
ncbi:anhydro-N-acetylmuramic acid kinase [Gemmatimonadetes bacterium T265]|nr:anhydro-N-acetylmuramic acid kinase [Gemmatimonadetes bacterium T265]